MKHGKRICNTLKQVRLDIARANDIDYTPTPCDHKGDCDGTCPACESEVRYLERQLARRRAAGKVALIAGISLGLSALAMPAYGQTRSMQKQGKTGEKKEQVAGGVKKPPTRGKVRPRYRKAPQFPGGRDSLELFIARNLRFPENVEPQEGRVVITFWVNKNGEVADPRVLESNLPQEYEAEALRLVPLLPKFKPGTVDGEPIRMQYDMPVYFKK